MKKIPANITFGALYEPAMTVTTEEEARDYFQALVERNMRLNRCGEEEAAGIERQNLGYFAGYYDAETQERVLRLFKAPHPIIKPGEDPFEAGLEWGWRIREGKE